jgi:hypothetical protein
MGVQSMDGSGSPHGVASAPAPAVGHGFAPVAGR